jgi:hypothetical protein
MLKDLWKKFWVKAVLVVILVTATIMLCKYALFPVIVALAAFFGFCKPKQVYDPVPPEVREKEEKAYEKTEQVMEEVKATQEKEAELNARAERIRKRQEERTGE